jgi:hypothetical protein
VLSYTLSNEWSNIIFLCEAGLNNTCGGPESISTNYAINIGKYFLIYPTVPGTKMCSSSDEFTLIGPTSVASTVI